MRGLTLAIALITVGCGGPPRSPVQLEPLQLDAFEPVGVWCDGRVNGVMQVTNTKPVPIDVPFDRESAHFRGSFGMSPYDADGNMIGGGRGTFSIPVRSGTMLRLAPGQSARFLVSLEDMPLRAGRQGYYLRLKAPSGGSSEELAARYDVWLQLDPVESQQDCLSPKVLRMDVRPNQRQP